MNLNGCVVYVCPRCVWFIDPFRHPFPVLPFDAIPTDDEVGAVDGEEDGAEDGAVHAAGGAGRAE